MEIALENDMPSYSGGLGVLAGDTIRAAADLRLPMVATSLLYRNGYFSQRLSEEGSQIEEPVEWRVEDFLEEEAARVSVPLENRRVELRAWRYTVHGVHGFEVPVYFLDAALPTNEKLCVALLASGLEENQAGSNGSIERFDMVPHRDAGALCCQAARLR